MVRAISRVSTFNRDRIDIIASILEAANGGATRRRILLISGLSNDQFKRYLSLLINDGYIRMEFKSGSKHRLYFTTGKGLAFLHAYSPVRELLEYDKGWTEW
jgi:predicted transcriptional regulator